MGAQFLNQPQGEGLTSDPREQFDFSGLSMLAQSARQASQIARERKMLRDLMRMSGQEVAEPAPEKGVMGGLKRVFGVGEEYQPISEMERLQGQAGIKKMFEPSMAETVELERQKAAAGRRPIEEELGLEEAKAGIKIKAAKQESTLKAIEHYKELANKEGWDLNLESTLSPTKQLQAARTLYATKMGEKPPAGKEKPTSWDIQKEAQDEAFRRLGGTSMVGLDEESRKQYDDLWKQLYNEWAPRYGFQSITAGTTPTKDQYAPEQEALIQDNMKAYRKTRKEIIGALTQKGLLK